MTKYICKNCDLMLGAGLPVYITERCAACLPLGYDSLGVMAHELQFDLIPVASPEARGHLGKALDSIRQALATMEDVTET